MAQTAVMDPTADRPKPIALPESGGLRFVAIRANLMPQEVLVARRVEALRRKVILSMAMLVAIVVAGYGASWLQTRSAQSSLDDVNHANTALTAQQQAYGPLVKAQADAATVQGELATLMVGDLPWSTLLASLRSAAPSGVSITSVAATVQTAAAPTSGGSNLNQSGKQAVGAITLSGTAGSKAGVSNYSDRLAKIKGITAPLITSVATAANGVTFSISLTITTDALGGRFTPATTSPAGGATAPAGTSTGTGGK